MSYFNEAYKATMKIEGGYVNDPTDAGGETYKGISRRFNASWSGWMIIDSYKNNEMVDFPNCLEYDQDLQKLVPLFYKAKYFDPFDGDNMSNELALEMFDTAVNLGIGRAIKFLQVSLNLLNRNATLYPDMVADGDYGPTTDKCYKAYMEKDGDQTVLLKMLNVMQGAHYIEYMKQSPTQEKYARGWFTRVEFTKVPGKNA